MPRARKKAGEELNSLQRHRRAETRTGTKLPGLRARAPRQPEFAAEAERQAALLRGRPEEREAVDFIEAAADWPPDE